MGQIFKLQMDLVEEKEIDSLLQKVKYLEEKGQYKNSRDILEKEMNRAFSQQIVLYWIESDQKILDSINVKNSAISTFEPNQRTWEEWSRSIYELIDTTICRDPAPIDLMHLLGKSSSELKAKRLEEDENKNFGLLSQEEIAKTLKTFDDLKKSVSTLQTIIDRTIQQNIKQLSTAELTELTKRSKQTDNLKKAIKDKRTRFLSYDAVSPYLTVVDQWLYLAKAKSSWFQKNKEAFGKAVKNLSLASRQTNLIQSSEDVRLQFWEVQKKLKSMVGKEEYEEIKLLNALQDSNDPDKKRGADAWWE